jgi:hypothetical protein
LHGTLDLSEFEAPRNEPAGDVDGPSAVPADKEVTTNPTTPTKSNSNATQLAQDDNISTLQARGRKRSNLNKTRPTRARSQEPKTADSNIKQNANPSPHSKLAVAPNNKNNVSTLQLQGTKTREPDPSPPSEVKTREQDPADENSVVNVTPFSYAEPEVTTHAHEDTPSTSSPTPSSTAHHRQSNKSGSHSEDTKSTQPGSSLPNQPKNHQRRLAAKDMGTGTAETAKSKYNTVNQNAKSKVIGINLGSLNNSDGKSTPKAKKTDNTPRPNGRPNVMTPLRKSVTPSQAYAGPTFLASPAASSLPIPKFLSKSVPDKQKSSSLKSAMESKSGKLPDNVEDSPTLRKSGPNGDWKIKSSTTQDIFGQESQVNDPEGSRNDDTSTTTEDSCAEAPSLALSRPVSVTLSPTKHPSYHARNATDGSIGGLFPFDIDDRMSASPKRQDAPSNLQPLSPVRQENVPSGIPDRPEISVEQRKAQSVALKKLLLSPTLQSQDLPPTSDHIDSEAMNRFQHRRSLNTPDRLDRETMKKSEYRRFLSTLVHPHLDEREGSHSGGFPATIGQVDSKEERLLYKSPLSLDLSSTSSSAGVRPTYQSEILQPGSRTLDKPLMPNLLPTGPARSYSSPSVLPKQADTSKTYNHTNLFEARANPMSSYTDNSGSKLAPWNHGSFLQYRDISPFAPSVLSAHSSYFCFAKKPIRDPEVTRSMEEYLQRIIS